ncbi:MAG: hypothetical protein IKW58_01685 [Alphaproteobacteria bacterium]|nr:hypothetical protein [Alphaproteobacteria bacterium]
MTGQVAIVRAHCPRAPEQVDSISFIFLSQLLLLTDVKILCIIGEYMELREDYYA